jgi:hypothetical protein
MQSDDQMLHQLMTPNTPIFFALALVLVGLLAWRFKPAHFRLLSWQAVGIGSALFWSVFAAVIIWYAWDSYYRYYAPSWDRIVAPLGAIVFYFLLGLVLRWAALHLPGNSTVTFCLLGGLESVPEHAIAIYRFHILQIPLLQDTTAAAIFIFAFFEYTVYWSLALCLAIVVDRLLSHIRKRTAQTREPPV